MSWNENYTTPSPCLQIERLRYVNDCLPEKFQKPCLSPESTAFFKYLVAESQRKTTVPSASHHLQERDSPDEDCSCELVTSAELVSITPDSKGDDYSPELKTSAESTLEIPKSSVLFKIFPFRVVHKFLSGLPPTLADSLLFDVVCIFTILGEPLSPCPIDGWITALLSLFFGAVVIPLAGFIGFVLLFSCLVAGGVLYEDWRRSRQQPKLGVERRLTWDD